MSASIGAASFGSRPELISATYRRLRRLGFGEPEAANLTALKSGFLISSQPWTVRELTRLLFLRELARGRGEWSGVEDRLAKELGEEWRVPERRTWDVDPSDGRVSLQSLLRGVAGRTATLEALAPKARRGAGVIHPGQEGGRSR